MQPANLPPPPPPPNQAAATAAAIAQCIRQGVTGQQFAAITFVTLGADAPAFFQKAAARTAEDLIEEFRAEPEAWREFAGIEDRLHQFAADWLGQVRELARNLHQAPAPNPRPSPSKEKRKERRW